MRPTAARRRDGIAWWRIAAAIGLVIAAVLVVRHGLAAATRKGRPAAALALAPFDSRALSAEAERILAAAQDAPARARAGDLARRALRRDPTNVSALATLGFLAAFDSDPRQVERLFDQAQKLSRRDLRTQIWFVESAVARGDVVGALRHYDIALRTTRSARDTLFPILSAAIAQPQVRVAAASTLASRPVWSDAFLYHVAISGPDPVATADLFFRLDRAAYPIDPETRVALVRRLVSAKEYDIAWARYAAMNGRATRTGLRAPDFRQLAAMVTPFDWVVGGEGGLSATLPDQRATGLDVQAGPSSGGVAATQLELLRPGRYRLAGRVRGVSASLKERPYWTLSCVGGSAAQLGRVPLPTSGEISVAYGGAVEVPIGCPAQLLQLVVPADDDIEGVAMVVESVAIDPQAR